ncbi:Enamine deaminase RidA, house cleaning of reactive enamine intermediates, YjgF/YER057c/UK114 family [Chitinophaga eiseniae]|uniref:Enamine deaminase RidA, house cleaning of reactive enamine intermediates, YjgF/YER057c/UK114 family n=1 Tax=Chitinophaga eiseniae TaxID=634771 RepID=A0A1T4U6T8_9BACT|nr:RidA family protein [Chitinophaga eiseniae]SKA48404.1 Enamine deaminase RidA, house cleaning of reactive enamine intermediates, YjgF/YER057c/UK114 family [Chitinophaga eiseniae]
MPKITVLLCFITCLFVYTGCKTSNTPGKKLTTENRLVKEKWHWNNPKKQDEVAGYAQVVKVGNTLYISGIPTKDLSPEGIARVYKALEKCLNAFGASSQNVVKETLYTTDIETVKKNATVRKEFYKGDYPAATWMQVSRLYEPEATLEIDLVAVLAGSDK